MFRIIFFWAVLHVGTTARAQTSQQTAAVVGGAVAAGVLTAIAVTQVKNNLEYRAIQHVLEKMPQYSSFRLRQFSWDIRKRSDISNTTMVPFLVEPKGQEPFLLLMVTSSGWVNEYGFDYSKVRFLVLDKQRWGDIMSAYLSLAGMVRVSSFKEIPLFHKNPRKGKLADYRSMQSRILKHGDDVFAEVTSINMGQIETVSAKGLTVYHLPLDRELWFPFVKMDEKSYRVVDFDDDLKVVYNRGSIGLFVKETSSLVQIKPQFLKTFSKGLITPTKVEL